MEVTICLTQASKFWKLVNWPGYLGSQCFLFDFVDYISKSITTYANQVKAQTQLLIDSLQTETKDDKKFQKILVYSNDLEKVRSAFKLFQLDVENRTVEPPSNGVQRRQSTSSKSGSEIDQKIHEVNSYLTCLIETLIGYIFDYKVSLVSLLFLFILNTI